MEDLEKTVVMPSLRKELDKKNKKSKKGKIKTILSSLIIIGSSLGLFLFYGPFNFFRDFWITSAMTTMTHQYLATWFYNDDVINKVLSKNHMVEVNDTTNPDLVNISDYNKNQTIYKNEYEKEILEHEDGALYKVIDIKGASRVSIATTKYLGKRGEAITTVAKRENAIIAMNAGGFYDPDWNSNGAQPHGTVISNGVVVSDFDDANMSGGFVGFNKENKLVLGKFTKEQAVSMGIRDAVEFGPFLIVNGKSSFIKGNGGWGIAPRTAIGQRSDGIVLFLVINGRLATSIGADMGDLTEIMENYGAVNAANMDGGSSSELVINNKIINHPVAAGTNGLRDMPTFWVVK